MDISADKVVKPERIEVTLKISGSEIDFKDFYEVLRTGTISTPRVIGLNQTKIAERLDKLIELLKKI